MPAGDVETTAAPSMPILPRPTNAPGWSRRKFKKEPDPGIITERGPRPTPFPGPRAASVKGRGPDPSRSGSPRPRGLTARAQLGGRHVLGEHGSEAPQPRHDSAVQRPVLTSAADAPAEVQGPAPRFARRPRLASRPRSGLGRHLLCHRSPPRARGRQPAAT